MMVNKRHIEALPWRCLWMSRRLCLLAKHLRRRTFRVSKYGDVPRTLAKLYYELLADLAERNWLEYQSFPKWDKSSDTIPSLLTASKNLWELGKMMIFGGGFEELEVFEILGDFEPQLLDLGHPPFEDPELANLT